MLFSLMRLTDLPKPDWFSILPFHCGCIKQKRRYLTPIAMRHKAQNTPSFDAKIWIFFAMPLNPISAHATHKRKMQMKIEKIS